MLLVVPVAHADLKREAYITLIYGDGYDLAARVMFQSLKETGNSSR